VRARLAAPPGCHVDVFFSTPIVSGRAATLADIARVRQKLASSSDVRTFAFVSKRLALRRETKRHPVLVQGLHGNPLPASYEIVPRSSARVASLEAQLRASRGVEHVSATKAC
jgi:cell division protein FtsX